MRAAVAVAQLKYKTKLQAVQRMARSSCWQRQVDPQRGQWIKLEKGVSLRKLDWKLMVNKCFFSEID